MKLLKLIPVLIIVLTSNILTIQAQSYTCLTYNIRYANENDGEDKWSIRKDFLIKQIQNQKPDFFGVQEALASQMDYLQEKLKIYQSIGGGRDDGFRKGEYAAIFYNSAKFKVMRKGQFWLSETPEEIGGIGWDAALPRICTFALLKDIRTQKSFWVFNTHFDHMGELARENSAKLIAQRARELNSQNLPVVIMGDLNMEAETEGIRILSDLYQDAKVWAKKTHEPQAGTFNGFKVNESALPRIDYIFLSKDIKKIHSYVVLVEKPNGRYPSDHFPIVVKFEFSK
ncbi:MAG: endonuclease/exonuclease/phosphatase family protein [Bacteroidia bacterium]